MQARERASKGERQTKIEKVTSCRKLCDLKKKSTGGVREHSPLAKTVDSAKKDAVIWGGGVISSASSPDRVSCQTTRKGWKFEGRRETCLKRNCSESLKDGQLPARKKYN